ncbi:2-succinyl-6-hydroxy-2,4-cyclohexadiene-1-carboxylate synthase [bacterium]|nr:2-succinyl-6-hydroxy-2,4-cyclohexadiene-1-carboxylate synthase [bacterium]
MRPLEPTTLPLYRLNEFKGNQIPVIFLHGFMGSAKDWDSLTTGLDFPALAVDLPGHGSAKFDLESPSWFEETSHLLRGTVELLGLKMVTLAGYSLGGRVAMDFASRFPELIHRLILESSHPGLPTKEERNRRIVQDMGWAKRIESNWPEVLRDWYGQSVFQNSSTGLDELVKLRVHNNPRLLAAALSGFSLGNQPVYGSFHVPCLYLAGLLDTKYVEIGRALEAKSSSVLLKLVEGAGHNVHLELGDQYLSLLTQFLESDLP